MKVVYCLRGTIFDVAVDLRRDSDTFLSYYSQIINSESKKFLMIPEGFAHGYQTQRTIVNCYIYTQPNINLILRAF